MDNAAALNQFHDALRAFHAGDLSDALRLTQAAHSGDPSHPVYEQAARYLETVLERGQANAYATPEGFTAFIRGGGNVPLYANTSAALAAVYGEYEALHLLDIGTGDGLALLPALTSHVAHVHVVEPSAALYATLTERLTSTGTPFSGFNGTLQDFAAQTDGHWPLGQATFSLQAIPFEARKEALAWLRQHVDRLLIVEFDAPDFREPLAFERVQYVVERYARGLAEYPEDEVVAQGFLMPVLFGYFDRGTARLTYEQPIAAWQAQLANVGFTTATRPIYPYFWADAVLIDAQ